MGLFFTFRHYSAHFSHYWQPFLIIGSILGALDSCHHHHTRSEYSASPQLSLILRLSFGLASYSSLVLGFLFSSRLISALFTKDTPFHGPILLSFPNIIGSYSVQNRSRTENGVVCCANSRLRLPVASRHVVSLLRKRRGGLCPPHPPPIFWKKIGSKAYFWYVPFKKGTSKQRTALRASCINFWKKFNKTNGPRGPTCVGTFWKKVPPKEQCFALPSLLTSGFARQMRSCIVYSPQLFARLFASLTNSLIIGARTALRA